ncbi:MAG: hypothetical protein QGF21_13140 [Vicinamibacterales bacterium]|nr:hypothetical protein [Vicinamibacterales bacterium]MDP7672878.1 hypothetical protein [Vicinamibacterales bacterium]HJO37315.1 hypothetical protein [Vicinamibacterales bacterium]
MNRIEMEQLIRNVDRRVAGIEQILPTLATKVDLERFATKADLEPLGTKVELKELRREMYEEGKRTRSYFDVVAEGLNDQIRLVGEGLAHVMAKLDNRG